uniref:Uncharacterized protein n=1 Tax=Anguilla anguilla TaxID=7936 RepID=A0A0E9TX40_ANGAN
MTHFLYFSIFYLGGHWHSSSFLS